MFQDFADCVETTLVCLLVLASLLCIPNMWKVFLVARMLFALGKGDKHLRRRRRRRRRRSRRRRRKIALLSESSYSSSTSHGNTKKELDNGTSEFSGMFIHHRKSIHIGTQPQWWWW